MSIGKGPGGSANAAARVPLAYTTRLVASLERRRGHRQMAGKDMPASAEGTIHGGMYRVLVYGDGYGAVEADSSIVEVEHFGTDFLTREQIDDADFIWVLGQGCAASRA